ncbi:MAG: protein-disulfide reductase DsbD [Methylophilaceae bacterium]|nr:protein-disulfide reductase DsbD [Methylophilaceae bacterium]
MQRPLITYFIFLFILLSLTARAESPFFDKVDNFLSADEAFQLGDIKKDSLGNLKVNIIIADGHYLYKSKTRIRNLPLEGYKLILPKGKLKVDEYFGEQEVFYESANLEIKVSDRASKENIELEIQGCSEKGLCYPPVIRNINYASSQPILNISESENISEGLTNKNFILSLLGFFVSGLLLSLTPCVLPMLPILSGIIISSNVNSAKKLTLVYVLGVCITYTFLGIVAGITGNLLSSSLQNTNFIVISSFLFVLLAASMFDFFQFSLPKSISHSLNQFSQKIKGGNLFGVFLLGLISSLILSPCVAPPLAGAILYIGQSENIILGGASLFFMGLGMSASLIFVGFSTHAVLPKPGPWMNNIKQTMAYILLAMAMYIARPLMDDSIFFSSLLLLLLIWFIGLARNRLVILREKLGLLIILVFLVTGTYLTKQIIHEINPDKQSIQKVTFININSIKDLNTQLNVAKDSLVLLDFYADWCVACLEYEKHTFSDPNVRSLMNKFVLLKADVTKNNEAYQLLLKKFNLYGPPGIIFFINQKEQKQYQIVGFKNANEFSKILEALINEDRIK